MNCLGDVDVLVVLCLTSVRDFIYFLCMCSIVVNTNSGIIC